MKSRQPKVEGRQIWAEISTGVLQKNFRAIREHLDANSPSGKRVKILAVVKGNGYGHGTAAAAKAFAKAGADWFGVTCSQEGIDLRESGFRGKPVLVLTGFWPGEENRIIEYGLTPAITDCRQLRSLERAAARAARKLRGPLAIHLKIDSGMNRLGVPSDSMDCVARSLADCPHLRLTGTFTHLASSEDFTSQQSDEQLKVFRGALAAMCERKIDPGIAHVANSAAVISRPETWMDMVRPGAILYGYHQNYNPPHMRQEAMRQVPLEAALSLCARIVSIRDIPAGSGVGYNARFRASQPSRIAIIAAGYADGISRSLSNRGHVVVRGKLAPLVGTVSMDLIAIDVTGIEGVEIGDVARIYGRRESPTAPQQDVSDVARLLGTVSSDLLCMISKRVPRIYVR
jgi:alanine racemase